MHYQLLCCDAQINKVSTRKEITLDNPNAFYSALFSMIPYPESEYSLKYVAISASVAHTQCTGQRYTI